MKRRAGMSRLCTSLIGCGFTALFIAASGAALSACGGGNDVPRAGQGTSLPGSWISSQPGSYVDFLSWTINGDSGQGNISESTLNGAQTQVSSNTVPFTATISGSSLTLNFTGSGTSYTGTVTTSMLQLEVPSSNGTIQQAEFVPGTIGTYNGDVQTLQTIAAGGQQQVQQQQTTQSEQSAIVQSSNAVANDIASIASGISALQGDKSSLQADLGYLTSDLNTVDADRSTVQNDLATNNGSTCGDANSAQGDADSTQGDLDSLQGDEGTFSNDISSLANSSSTLQSDWSTYISAQSALPNYVPSSASSNSPVQAARQQASAAITQFKAYESQVTASGQSLVNQANQIAGSLVSQACG